MKARRRRRTKRRLSGLQRALNFSEFSSRSPRLADSAKFRILGQLSYSVFGLSSRRSGIKTRSFFLFKTRAPAISTRRGCILHWYTTYRSRWIHWKPNDSLTQSKGNGRLPRDRQAPQFLIPMNHIHNECWNESLRVPDQFASHVTADE